MTNLTKKAIKESFIALLNERAYNKITVKDIVDGCGINRNTFYYHYHDIPDLLEELIQETTDQINSSYPSLDSFEQCLEAIAQAVSDNRKAMLHIYNSINRDIFERHLWKMCDHTIRTYFSGVAADLIIEDDDLEMIINYYICTTFGTISQWLSTGMNSSVTQSFHRILALIRHQIEDVLLQYGRKS